LATISWLLFDQVTVYTPILTGSAAAGGWVGSVCGAWVGAWTGALVGSTAGGWGGWVGAGVAAGVQATASILNTTSVESNIKVLFLMVLLHCIKRLLVEVVAVFSQEGHERRDGLLAAGTRSGIEPFALSRLIPPSRFKRTQRSGDLGQAMDKIKVHRSCFGLESNQFHQAFRHILDIQLTGKA
jgi:hypothetical protein